jgi:glycosyltransferase involved in cell wall biosynthesis
VANFYGGPERQIHGHALAAKDRAVDVTVGTFADGDDVPAWIARLSADGVRTRVLGVSSPYDPRAIRALRRVLRSERFDVLCTHDYRTTVIAALALRGTRTRWVAFSRGATWDDLKVRVYQGLESIVIRMASRVAAVSAAQAARLRRALVPRRKILPLRNAVDLARLAAVRPADLRSRFGFEAESVVGVSAGRFSAEKGQKVLVAALAEALREVPELRFVAFGDGPDLASVRARIQDLGLGGKVLCPGFEEDVLPSLRGADLVVNPSLSEGHPNVVLEALGLGRVVVATSVGGVPELVSDGRTGYLVAPGRPDALAEGIVRAVRERAASDRLAAAARDDLARRFSFAAQLGTLERLYRIVARAPGGGRSPSSRRDDPRPAAGTE